MSRVVNRRWGDTILTPRPFIVPRDEFDREAARQRGYLSLGPFASEEEARVVNQEIDSLGQKLRCEAQRLQTVLA